MSEREGGINEKGNNEWEQIGKRGWYWRANGKKRKKQGGASSGGTEREGREEDIKIPKTGPLIVVVRFVGEEGVMKIDPLKPKSSELK